MKKFSLIIFIAVSFLFLGCFSKAEEQNPQKNLTREVLIKENYTGIKEPRNIVVKTQKEFDALWAESQMGIDFGPAKPKVDFGKKWVIACFLGTVNTGGHSLDIESIKAGAGKTLITIIHKRPSRDCFTAQVIEDPYLMVAIDHFLPEIVEFKMVAQEIPCE